jgi:hypothetical protein
VHHHLCPGSLLRLRTAVQIDLDRRVTLSTGPYLFHGAHLAVLLVDQQLDLAEGHSPSTRVRLQPRIKSVAIVLFLV